MKETSFQVMYTCFFNSSIYDKSIFRKAALTSAIQKSLKWLWLTSQIMADVKTNSISFC